jgi:hypothetical protein
MRQILERLDVMPNQVLLEATIAEVRLTDDLHGPALVLPDGQPSAQVHGQRAWRRCRRWLPASRSFFNTPNVQVVLTR